MNEYERHYPHALKFVMVALMGFSVYIFFQSFEYMVKLYSIIMFFIVLNGWAASEDTKFKYGDLYLLVDAICAAMYYISLLELNRGTYNYFWLYSSIIFLMYFIWNKLLIIENVQSIQKLNIYNNCDIFACICSLGIFFTIKYINHYLIINILQYYGMVLWTGLLLKWYIDFYIHSYKTNNDTKERSGQKEKIQKHEKL